MCGIAGLIAEKDMVVRQALAPMVACQTHRGPDDAGEQVLPFGNRFLGLGHRRLSILDLSAAGHQPMAHPVTGDQIVFNGEIYNFAAIRKELTKLGETFTGHSDTEVMLHALTLWGPSAVARFEGMFAFAFYSRKDQQLMLARDSVGIKPLYVAQPGGTLIFASEVRAILSTGLVSRKLNVAGVAGMLAYGAVQQPMTLFEHIKCFPPGHYQLFTPAGAADPVKFWDYPLPRLQLSESDAVEQLRATLDNAVREHLVADVPVGIFLSSGLDSTIIAGLAARHTTRLRSFTVGFADHKDFSEQAMATETAKLFGLDHTNIDLSAHDAEAAIVEWLQSLDQPSMDGLNVFVIAKAVRAHGITVALSGQGGDELFGGYASFADVPRLFSAMRKVRWMPASLRGVAAGILGARRSHAVRQKLIDVFRSDGAVLSLALQRRRAISDNQMHALGLDAHALGLDCSWQPHEAIDAFCRDGDQLLWQISQAESRYYQGNMLLRDGDTNGMANSLEIRLPILDQRVINLAYSLPDRVRLPGAVANKYLLRKAFPSFLRDDLSRQGKRGFSLPIRRWMAGPLRDRCETALATLKDLGLLAAGGIDSVWNTFLADQESPTWSRAFSLCVLGTYIDRMGAVL